MYHCQPNQIRGSDARQRVEICSFATTLGRAWLQSRPKTPALTESTPKPGDQDIRFPIKYLAVSAYLIAVVMSGSVIALLLLQPAVVWIVAEIVLANLPDVIRRTVAANCHAVDPIVREQRRDIERQAVQNCCNRFYFALAAPLLTLNVCVLIGAWFVSVHFFGDATSSVCFYLLAVVSILLVFRFLHDYHRCLGIYYVGAVERHSRYLRQPLTEGQLRELHERFVPTRFRSWGSIRRLLTAVVATMLLHAVLVTKTNVVAYMGSRGGVDGGGCEAEYWPKPSTDRLFGEIRLGNHDISFPDEFPISNSSGTPDPKRVWFGHQFWYPNLDFPPSIIELYVSDDGRLPTKFGEKIETYWGDQLNGYFVHRWLDQDCVVLFYEEDRVEAIRISRETARWIANLLEQHDVVGEDYDAVLAEVEIDSALLSKN